jgi:hypothetical protein
VGLEELVLPEGYRIGYRFFLLPCRLGKRRVWGWVAVVQRYDGKRKVEVQGDHEIEDYEYLVDEWCDCGFYDDVIERLRGQGKPVVEPDWEA